MDETISPNLPQELHSENTVTFKRSHLYALLLPLAFVVGLSVGYLFWGRGGAGAPQPQAQAQAPAAAQEDAQQQWKRYDVPEDDDPSLGPKDAPITIIEFSDYECPFCKRWHQEVFLNLRKDYADQVRVVYRDFPLPSHPNAQPAAEAANCAGDQGKYWEYHDKLFGGDTALSTDLYKQYAGELGLDTAKFDECINSGKYKSEVESDFNYAANLGVTSTPTFFINGIPLVGAQPYDVFKDVIAKELAGELPK